MDYGAKLKQRQDSVVGKGRVLPSISREAGDDDGDGDDLDPCGGLFDDEQKKMLEIKEYLEEPDQVCILVFS